MIFDNQKLAIQAAIKTAIGSDKEKLRIVRIRDTLHLSEIQVSEAIFEEIRSDPAFEVICPPQELPFDQDGNLF